MKKILSSPLFLIYLFILFFVIVNVYLIFQFDTKKLFDSFVMINLFWVICIIILKIISNKITFTKG